MLVKTPVFQRMSDRPFAHCSTLTDLGDAGLMVIWMGGEFETATNVSLLASRLPKGETEWTKPKVLIESDGHSLGQPVLLQRPDGELWLFYNLIREDHWENAVPYLTKSSDGGATWGESVLLFDTPGLMLRSRPHVINGRIILPAYDENTWRSCMILSDDDGKTWRVTAPMASPQGNIHPNVVQLPDGRLLCYLRTGGRGVIWRSESLDNGETWSELEQTRFPNPNAGIDLFPLASGQFALTFNNSAELRTPLTIALSSGLNEDWQKLQTVDAEYAELSYPSMAQTADGQIHLTYTYRRQTIIYATFTQDWLAQGAEL